MSKTLSMDVNGDGAVDFLEQTTTTLNADGTARTVIADFVGNGTLLSQSVTSVNANGLIKTTQYDLNGDGVTDETQTDVTAYASNGTKTHAITTRYADGTLKDSATTTITQNAYKTITSTDYDVNGDGAVDRTELTSIDQDGYRIESIQYYSNGQSVSRIDTRTSPDGLTTYYPVYVLLADGTWGQVAQETLLLLPNANGSYFFQTSGTNGQTFMHTIDANNVDNWVWTDPGTVTYHTLRIDMATEEKLFDIARRLYDTVLDRSISQAETQKFVSYISSNGILDSTGLANELLASTEFTQKYGTLSNTQFVERAYQNAFGRAASLSELTALLAQLNSGALTRTKLLIELSESTEHLLRGNGHLVTNNTGLYVPTLALEHSNDKQIIAAIIQNLYDTALDRQATAAEVTAQGDKILTNAKTQAQVAADILALAEFSTKYGTLTNAGFVTQIFLNALGRAPTSAEQSFWTASLDASTVSRADLLDALAQSSDHLAVAARPIATAGNDTIYSRDGADIIDGLAGSNTVDYSLLTSQGVTANLTLGTGIQANGLIDQLANIQNLTGSGGADALTGNSGANVLMGGAVNDTLDGGAGNDTLTGGAGTDTVSYATAASGVTVSLALTAAQATGSSGTDTPTGFENLTGSAFADTLIGSAGTNTLTGKAGDDTYVVQDSTDIVTELANEGTDTVLSSVTYTLGANVENLTLTGSAAINGTGNALDNVITGNSAVNTLAGGAGNDTYIIQNTADVVTEAASAGTDTVQFSVTYTLGANVENLTLTGTAAINATGNALANTLTGNAADNVLDGGAGNDTLAGGTGSDIYVVDSASDVVTVGRARAPTRSSLR